MTPYDKTDKASILNHARLLLNKTLRRVVDHETIERDRQQSSGRGKGAFGQRVERILFGIKNNSESRPDLPEAGVEIKTTPLKKIRSGIRSKERLSLNIIDYEKEYKLTFETSTFWKKNELLLLMFYLHEVNSLDIDYIFKIINYWSFPTSDRAIIQQDWNLIVGKIKDGKAHQLSEGDTLYLGACTKGSKGGNLRAQPFNKAVKAKQRAFSLKQGYVNHIIATLKEELGDEYGKIIKNPTSLKRRIFEDIVVERFQPYYGMTPDKIISSMGLKVSKRTSKEYYASITKAILGIGQDKEIEEFAKADITVRTSRVDRNGLPEESVSFPYFEYKDLVKETWDNSDFKIELERKFFFVFFQYVGNTLVLRKVRFWNMPYADILEAKKVWRATIALVKEGKIVSGVSAKGIRSTYFPKSNENCVSHVRPHARNSADTANLPVQEKFTKAWEYTKHSFWLNDKYVRNEIFLK